MIAPAGGPDTKLSERHESHLHSPIGRTRLLAVGLSGPPSRDRWLSGERPVPIHSIDCDKVDFVFVNFGVEGETVGKWYESESFVEWLSSYCMGGRIVEISREGDGEISNYSATPRSEQHSPPWLIAEKLGTLSVPGGNAEVFEQGKDVLTDRFIMLIKLHRHNQIRELAPLWPVVGRE